MICELPSISYANSSDEERFPATPPKPFLRIATPLTLPPVSSSTPHPLPLKDSAVLPHSWYTAHLNTEHLENIASAPANQWRRDRRSMKLELPTDDVPLQLVGSPHCAMNFEYFQRTSDDSSDEANAPNIRLPLLLVYMSDRGCSHVPSHPTDPDGGLDVATFVLEKGFVANLGEKFKMLVDDAANYNEELKVYGEIASHVSSLAVRLY